MSNRKSHWEQIYTDKSPLEVSWFQAAPELSLQLIRNTGFDTSASIIDVGGGASTLIDHLSKTGFQQLAVLDISAAALEHAKNRLGDSAAHIEWFEADVTDFTPPHRFDIWHDRAVFHFLTDTADREKYISTLQRTLTDAGQLIIAAFAIGGPRKCSGLDIVQYDADKLCAELGNGFRLLEQQDEIHRTPGGGQQEFSYYRFSRTGN